MNFLIADHEILIRKIREFYGYSPTPPSNAFSLFREMNNSVLTPVYELESLILCFDAANWIADNARVGSNTFHAARIAYKNLQPSIRRVLYSLPRMPLWMCDELKQTYLKGVI